MGNHDLRTVNISVALAVYTFSGGATALGRVLEEMGLHVGIFSSDFFVAKDSARIKNARRQASQATHKARRAKRRKRLVKTNSRKRQRVSYTWQGGIDD